MGLGKLGINPNFQFATEELEGYELIMKPMILRGFALLLCLIITSHSEEEYKPQNFSTELLKKAETGDPKAQLQLAGCYKEGRGIGKDKTQALGWIEKSANQKYLLAQLMLGQCYLDGEIVQKDEKKAFQWYKKAAEGGCVEAQYNVGSCYYNGTGTLKNNEEAFKWVKKATEQPMTERFSTKAPDAYFILGQLYDRGEGCEVNKKEAITWMAKAADQGNVDAQNYLAMCYLGGNGVEKDSKEAFRRMKIAADRGNAKSQANLGWCYANGIGVTKDANEAIKWYTKAAEQGNADAQYEVGQCYFYGLGTSKNDIEAFKWTSKSAEQGNGKAEYNLGACYLGGFGTSKNKGEAFKWYKKAAEKDVPLAQYNLGILYQNGIGVEKNEAEALTWFTKSADQGIAEAKKVVSRIKGEADAKRMLKDIENKETVRKEKVGNRWLANMLTHLKERYEQTAEQIGKIYKHKSEIDGYIFTQLGIIGLYSYHFDLKNGSYINFENIPKEHRYDDGTALPQKVYFKNERYEPEKKEYNANVVFEKSCLGWIKSCKYKIIFDNSFGKINSGNVQFFDSSGNLIRTKAFGTKIPQELNYTRYGQSSTNPQQNL